MKSVVIILLFIGAIGFAIVFPLLVIWALNTLFGLSIPYGLETWSAVVLLQMFFQTSISYKGKK